MNRMEMKETYFKNEVWIHYGFVKKLLFTLTVDGILTEDLAQDTMLICWKQIEKISRYKNLKSALATIARNEYNKFNRSRKSRMEELMDPDKLRWIAEASNIEDYIRQEGDVHEFLLLFTGIKREYVQVVLLVDYYEFSLKEVAKLMHMNYNTVASHHVRGLDEMRKHKGLFDKLTRRHA